MNTTLSYRPHYRLDLSITLWYKDIVRAHPWAHLFIMPARWGAAYMNSLDVRHRFYLWLLVTTYIVTDWFCIQGNLYLFIHPSPLMLAYFNTHSFYC